MNISIIYFSPAFNHSLVNLQQFNISCDGSSTLRLLREDVLQSGAPITLPDDAVSEIFLDNLKTAFGATAGTCKACHDAYRGK